jgi:alkanesulfonate monooxygenase SsuD/methylene tetrahydromethanopterin reductase-like flavin-dependent oxidoreductase (luciferase family)
MLGPPAEIRAGPLGPDVLVAPHQNVILETDRTRPGRGRAACSVPTSAFPTTSTTGCATASRDEIDTVGHRLVDSLLARGTPDDIAQRIQERFDAGADHVALQIVDEKGFASGLDEQMPAWRELAKMP